MNGPLALIGGQEHTPGCEPIDRRLLELSGAEHPVVTILPFASSRRTRIRAVDLAVSWWRDHLGVDVLVAPTNGHGCEEEIARADVLVMTGGVPDRLFRRLGGSVVWNLLLDRWYRGVPLSGASSGAMVVAGHRQCVQPPFLLVPGLSLLPHVAVAPHHEHRIPRLIATVRTHTHPDLTIVGIEDRTALLAHGGRFEVLGSGVVTVRRGRWSQVHPPGTLVDPRELGMAPASTPSPGSLVGMSSAAAP